MLTAPYRSSYYRNSVQEKSCIVASTNTTFNLNGSTTNTIVPINSTVERIDDIYSSVTNGIQCNFSGRIKIKVTILARNTAGTNMGVRIFAYKNTTALPRSGILNHINTTTGGYASCEFTQEIDVLQNDVIYVYAQRVGAAGTVNMISNACALQVTRAAIVNALVVPLKNRCYIIGEDAGTVTNSAYNHAFGAAIGSVTNYGVLMPRSGKVISISFLSTTGTAAAQFRLDINGVGVYIMDVPTNVSKHIENLASPIAFSSLSTINLFTVTGGSRARSSIIIEVEFD